MAAQKGHPRWGGRGKGGKNHSTRQREQAAVHALIAEKLSPAEVETLMPLPVLLRIMRSRVLAGDEAGAAAMAALAAPYCHSRLASSDVRVSGSLTTKSDAVVQAEIGELLLHDPRLLELLRAAPVQLNGTAAPVEIDSAADVATRSHLA